MERLGAFYARQAPSSNLWRAPRPVTCNSCRCRQSSSATSLTQARLAPVSTLSRARCSSRAQEVEAVMEAMVKDPVFVLDQAGPALDCSGREAITGE